MEFVGKTVKKKFEVGGGVSTGTVKSYDPSSGFFVIAYEGGDLEELDFTEVADLLREKKEKGTGEAPAVESSFSMDGLGRKPKKRRRVDPRDRENEVSDLDLNCSVDLNDDSVGDLDESEIVNGNLDGNVGLLGSETLVKGRGGTGGIDLNLNLNLDEEFDLNEEWGSIPNAHEGFVGMERKMECIDLNLDAGGELDEGGLKENGETPKRECGFDLNVGITDVEEEGIQEEGGNELKEGAMCRKIEVAFRITRDEGFTDNVCNGDMEDIGLSNGLRDGTRGEDVDARKDEISACGDGTSVVNSSGIKEVINGSQCYGGSVPQEVTDGPKRRGRRRKVVKSPNSTSGKAIVDATAVTGKLVLALAASHQTICSWRRGRRRKVEANLDFTSEANEVKEYCTTTGTDGNRGGAFIPNKEVSGGRRRGRKKKVVDNSISTPEKVVFADANGVKEDSTRGADENQGDLGSRYGGVNGSGRKKQKLLDDMGFVPETTVLRRSSRRGSAKNSISTTRMSSVDDSSGSPAGSALTEEKVVKSPSEWPVEPVAVPPKASLPPSSQNLDLIGIPIFDIFSIYACLRSFSTLLFLSPFELEEFVTALKCNYPSPLFGCIHVSILQTLRKHLEHLSSEGSESASNCLRNLNWDLLDLITWPVFMVEYLLIQGADLKLGFDLSCLNLFKSEYHKQPASVKVEILRCLCDDMIEVDAIRSEINRRCLGIESDLDFDRGVNISNCRKKRVTMDISSGSRLTQEAVDDTNDWNSDECCLCKMEGNLICCDGCPAAYHSKCVGVANSSLPEGNWYCPECAIEKHNPWMKHRKSVRGAELLGVDPYSRLYFSSCGYLLVSDSCDDELSFKYYHKSDLMVVIEVLKSSGRSYGSLLKAIREYWDMPALLDGTSGNLDSLSHNICLDICIPSGALPLSERSVANNKAIDGRKPEEQLHIRCSDLPDNEMSKSVSPRCMSSEGSAEITQISSGIQNFQKEAPDLLNRSVDFSNESEILGKPPPNGDSSLTSDHLDCKHENDGISISVGHAASSISPTNGDSVQLQATTYMNFYSFGHTASLIAEALMSKSADRTMEVPMKTYEEIVSAEMKVISKKATKFCWPNMPSLSADVQKEMCGWCYCCRYPTDDSDCLVNMSLGPIQEGSLSDVGIQLKMNRIGYLTDIIRYILLTEDRLQGLLLGPWMNSHYSRIWRESVQMATDIVSLKHSLLMLESNLHRRALSVDWWKHVDSAVTMGSASHIVTASSRASSKNVVVQKRVRSSDFDSNSSSSSASGLVMFWHRGGRLSRKVFSWKVLPDSLVSKAAREAGSKKVPGIMYPENSDFAKRSKYVMWRAAVESSTTVEQLALQVRELDSNIQWNEIENTHLLPILDKEFIKSIRLFKKVIIRRKSVEGGGVKYLLDFGKRRSLPEVVIKNGVRVEEPSSERKKYWLNESFVPLHMLKNFEEKRIARKSQMGPVNLSQTSAELNKPQKKQGFSYLFEKAERSEHYQCGHCNKSVPISEAVCCQHCKGFFHRRHVKKSGDSLIAECVYECHRCSGGKQSKNDVKTKKNVSRKAKNVTKNKTVQEKNSEKATVSCKSVLLKNSKKTLKSSRPLRSQSKKKVSVVPLRRSARKSKYKALQNKKVAGRKRGRPPKSKTGPYQKLKEENSTTKKRKIENSLHRKRTMTYHSYWVNGLQLSRKPDDERVILFREERLLTPFVSVIRGQPKCLLCGEAGYTSSLSYISCEMCGDWFHGEAFGLDAENIHNLIGFRCHICRETPPPTCPNSPELQDAEIVSSEEVTKTTSDNQDAPLVGESDQMDQ